MIVKEHKSQDRLILAVCDKDLIGKKITENNKQLDLSSDFYKGRKQTKERILGLFKMAYSVNLVGEKSVKLGKEAGIVDKKNILFVDKVPHAQVLLMR